MEKITGLDRSPRQKISFIADSLLRELELYYSENTQAWYFSITSDNFNIKNKKLSLSINILRQFKKIINWGITIISSDGQDPVFIQDFEEKRVKIFILSQSEVEEIEDTYIG